MTYGTSGNQSGVALGLSFEDTKWKWERVTGRPPNPSPPEEERRTAGRGPRLLASLRHV